jgi:broad specificity phosphatase PhoE
MNFPYFENHKIVRTLNQKTVYLIRHGQTGHNHRGIIQGRYVNSSLSKKGFRQASLFYERYRDTGFQKVYTSSLLRTKQTVKPFLDDGIQHEALPGLDEICWGDSEGKFANSEDNKQYWHIIETWKSGDLNPRLKGGENPLEVQVRQQDAMQYIARQKEELVLVCMHGRALKIMLAWITGQHLKEMDRFKHDNLSLYILNYVGGAWKIRVHDERSHLKMLKVNSA